MRPSSRRSRLSLAWTAVLIFIFGLLLPLGLSDLAPPALAKRAATTLDDAVAAALTDAGYANADRVHVVPAEKQGDWSFGTSALLGTETADAPPDIMFYIAQREGKRWRAEVESTASYSKLLRQAPPGFVPRVFLDTGGVRAQANEPPAWAMPVGYPGEFRLTRAPFPIGGDTPNSFALELADPGPPCNGAICATGPFALAMAGGYAVTPCGGASAGGSIVVVRHAGGWQTTYRHIFPSGDFPRQVARQGGIGTLWRDGRLTCDGGGDLYPERVGVSINRFTSQGIELAVDLEGQVIGGWTFASPPENEQVCLLNSVFTYALVREPRVACEGETFVYDGAHGDGASFRQSPARPKPGEKVGITTRNMPRGGSGFRFEVVYLWYDPGTLVPRENVVKSFLPTTSVKDQYVTFKQPRGIPKRDAKLCIRYQFGEFDGYLLTCKSA